MSLSALKRDLDQARQEQVRIEERLELVDQQIKIAAARDETAVVVALEPDLKRHEESMRQSVRDIEEIREAMMNAKGY
jgi:predicted  nucleic acid-binding Zn-ribbon protein